MYIPIALEKVKDVVRKEWNKARLKPSREKSGSDNSMSVFGTLVSKGLHDLVLQLCCRIQPVRKQGNHWGISPTGVS